MKGAIAIVMFVLATLLCHNAQAVVTLAGTRLVFDGRFAEAKIEIRNPGHTQVLIQAWLTDAGANEAAADLPFVLTPHLAQLPPQGRQTLRVLYQGVGMPQDRESLLHLYVLEVPRRSAPSQQLNIAVRQRINVFYRPAGLEGDAAEAAQHLAWQWDSDDHQVLRVRNPTPFHVALHKLAFNQVEVAEDLMLAPFSARSLPLQPTPTIGTGETGLSFSALTDYGGLRDFCAPAQYHTPFTARLRPSAGSSIGKC
nr:MULTISPECIES: molecular chaperone [unclassified Pseudomonas]